MVEISQEEDVLQLAAAEIAASWTEPAPPMPGHVSHLCHLYPEVKSAICTATKHAHYRLESLNRPASLCCMKEE
jgi:hypothetical protein